jgi:hypothetical protein
LAGVGDGELEEKVKAERTRFSSPLGAFPALSESFTAAHLYFSPVPFAFLSFGTVFTNSTPRKHLA